MHPGFSFSPDSNSNDIDAHFQKLAMASGNYPESPEGKFLYDFVTPVLGEGDDSLTVSDNNRPFIAMHNNVDYRKLAANQPIFNGRENGLPITMPANFAKMAAFPNPNMAMNQYQNMPMNLQLNTSFERSLQNSGSKGEKAPSLNNLNNVSRDSRNGSRTDLSTSRRNNMSSKTNGKGGKNFQVAVNDDINLIERIEAALNQISLNHNKICPFCSKVIDIKKCNFQNISAFLSNTSKKYYLTHFDCYLKSNSAPDSAKILPLTSIAEAKISSQNALTSIDTNNYLRSDKKAYFVHIEGFHPISSYLLFKIEKICNGLEHVSHRNQLLHINFGSRSTSIFEPNAYTIPFGEFRMVISIYMSHSTEDPYVFEFLMDFSQVKLGLNQKSKFAEAFYLQGGNNIILSSEVVFDSANDFGGSGSKANLDSSFQSTGSTSAPSKPDFGKNLFVMLKNVSISLPLKRIEARSIDVKVASKTSLDEPIVSNPVKPTTGSGQKKPLSKLQLNPNAPLFSTPDLVPQQQQQQQPKMFMPTGGQNDNQFNQNMNPNLPPHMNYFQPGPRMNNTANGFNAPLFPQNFQFEQILPPNINSQPNNNNFDFTNEPPQNQNEMRMPPGLNFGFMPQSQQQQQQQPNQPFNMNPMFSNQPVMKNGRSLYIETKAQPPQEIPTYIKEEEEPLDTPVEAPIKANIVNQDGSPALRIDRAKSKGQLNLYTAVLSGKFKEGSIINSPALNKIHNHYFSEISNPGSGINTPEANTPMYQSPKANNFNTDEVSTPQWTEDMMENFKLEDYVGRLVEFAKTYNGSRVLQRFFPRANQQEVEVVILELQDHIEELMLDPYANYMFQTLAQSCSSEQRYYLLKIISPSMIKIACDRKGTHSLQAIVSLMNRDVEDKLIRDTLDGHVVELAFDAQGTHLIQKLIVSISLDNIEFIYRPLMSRFLDVANHAFGLCVLKQLMTKVEKNADLKREIINLLHQHFEELVQNPYGNYAIQHAFDVYPRDCNIIFERVVEKIVQYSNQKFSSNVVEKCISIGPMEIKKKYVKEILKSDRIVELMKNKYGNYVILKILAAVETEDKQAIMQGLTKTVNLVNVSKYKSRWIQFIEENPLKIPGVNSTKTHRPSLFKNSAQAMDNFHNNGSEVNSPMTADDWSNLRQAAVRRGSKELQEEKSHFFHENARYNRSSSNNNVEENVFEERNQNYYNTQQQNQYEYDRGVDDTRSGTSGNMSGNGDNSYENGNKYTTNENGAKGGNSRRGKNPNHKFYTEKSQHHKNKWGYNYFY